jgi:centractin
MDESVIANQPVVIDNGSGMIKAGFAGGEQPRVVFPSHVGRTKHRRVMPGGELEGAEVVVGERVAKHRGVLKISYPMEHGVVTDWDDMERVWQHVYSREHLNIPPEEHPVLLTEPALNPSTNRERAAQVFFETFNAPTLFIATQAILSLYASGRTTGVVLDVGDGVSHAVPVYEGFSIPHAITRVDVAGRDVTEQMQRLLRRGGRAFSSSAEKEVVRRLKEEHCYVAYEPAAEERGWEGAREYEECELPDGTKLQLGAERFRAPEVLFQPSLIGSECPGVSELLHQTVMAADMDLRKTLFGAVVLSGGSTLFPGFGDRLLNDLRKLAPADMKIKITAPPERKTATWIGGSILASLATFKSMWVRKDEYEEHGESIIHRKTL